MNESIVRALAMTASMALGIAGCSGSANSSATPLSAASANPAASAAPASASIYPAAYKTAKWQPAVTVSFPSSCTMTFSTMGVPPFHNDYYLAPVSSAYPTAVAETPVSKTEMSVVPYMPAANSGQTMTFNTCPSKAASTTPTNPGVIGYTVAGEAIFNSYEGNGFGTPALSDNVSYSFTTSAGVAETASFIDACNSHATPLASGNTWHYHGDPVCLAAQLDGTTGPSHVIGIALDGFPIYGGRDINGNTIAVSQLDACNGITSPTPEFPNGAYHYVLPIGVTGSQSSMNCYAGTVSTAQMMAESRYFCGPHLQAGSVRAADAARPRKTAYLALR